MIFTTKISLFNLGLSVFIVVSVLSMQSFAVLYNHNCPNLAKSLGQGCNVNSDCTKIKCSIRFVEKDIKFTLEIDKCGNPVTVTARVEVQALRIDWSHKYTSDDIVAVPGFTVNLPAISGGVYVQVQLDSNSDKLKMKVNLLVGATVFGHTSYPVKTTVIDGDLPIDTSDCGTFGWWIKLGTVWKIIIPTAALVVVIVVVLICVCVCCPKKRRPTTNQSVVVVPAAQPTLATMTTANNGAPMQPMA